MPNKYQIYEAVKVERQTAKFPVSLPSPEEIAKHMADHGILNRDELSRLQEQIDQHTKDAESGVVAKLASILYFWAKDRIKISPETLFYLMANFDKIKGYMPNEFWKNVVDVIDKIGEYLYDKERTQEK